MQTEDTATNDSCQREVIEKASEFLPNFCVSVLTETLIVESIDLSDLLGLVVTTKDCDPIWETNLHANQKADGLNGVVTAIDVISHEQVVGIRDLSANLEQFLKIVELSMDITANRHRGLYLPDILLSSEKIFGGIAKFLNMVLSQGYAFQQSFN